MLIDVLSEHIDHPEFGKQITELREHVIAREADKNFYACMIRKFNPAHEILSANYIAPTRPRKEKDSQFMCEESLQMYQAALMNMPKLKSGKASSKIKRGGIVGSLNRPRTAQSK